MCLEDTSGKKTERGMPNFVWCNIHWCTLYVFMLVASLNGIKYFSQNEK